MTSSKRTCGSRSELAKIKDPEELERKLLLIKEPHMCHVCLVPTPDCVKHMRNGWSWNEDYKTWQRQNKGKTVEGNESDDRELLRHHHLRRMQEYQVAYGIHATVEIGHLMILLDALQKSTPDKKVQILMAFVQELGHFPVSAAHKLEDAKFAGFFENSPEPRRQLKRRPEDELHVKIAELIDDIKSIDKLLASQHPETYNNDDGQDCQCVPPPKISVAITGSGFRFWTNAY
uniref:Uncharacterized protein n=1 Tax=Ditylenchus dipsaci TaxID=166011 RepID=A0A915EIT9_9BILA